MDKIRMGKAMRKARIEAGLSQMDVVDVLDIRQCTLSLWENGHSGITLNYMEKLADLYGCTLDRLVGYEKS